MSETELVEFADDTLGFYLDPNSSREAMLSRLLLFGVTREVGVVLE